MIEALVRRWGPLAALAILVGGLLRVQRVPGPEADLYFHLRLGREFLEGWSLSHPGHLGAFDTADWQPTQWLAQVTMASAERLAGFTGVMWLSGVLVLALPVALYVACRRTTAPLPAAIATAAATLAAVPGLTARPQVLSYLLVVVVMTAWQATIRDGRPRYWLVLVAWLWVPLHGMWPIGIAIGVVAVAGLCVERRLPLRRLGQLAAIPLASLLISLATPLGTGALRTVVGVGSRSSYFAEWGPTDFTEPYALVLLAMFAVVFADGLRRGRMPWPRLLLVGLALGWACYSMRTTPVAALMVAPFVAEAVQHHVPRADRMGRVEGTAVAAIIGVGAAVLWPVVGSRSDATVVPAWLDSRLSALPDDTRVLNDWDTGSYFLWRHPQLDLVMHGYGDVFTDAELERNQDILRLKPAWDERVAELDADIALVDPDTALGYALRHDLGWTVVQADQDFALLDPPG